VAAKKNEKEKVTSLPHQILCWLKGHGGQS